MNPYMNNPARPPNLVESEEEERRQGFDNKTMRRASQTKPHIARVLGIWRVSPWKPGAGKLYYEAHRFVTLKNNEEWYRLTLANEIAAGVAKCHSPSTHDFEQRQLAKKLRHGANYSMGTQHLVKQRKTATLGIIPPNAV